MQVDAIAQPDVVALRASSTRMARCSSAATTRPPTPAGREVWKTDGTPSRRAVLVKDIFGRTDRAAERFSLVRVLVPSHSHVLQDRARWSFPGTTSVTGSELWMTDDGTSAGTRGGWRDVSAFGGSNPPNFKLAGSTAPVLGRHACKSRPRALRDPGRHRAHRRGSRRPLLDTQEAALGTDPFDADSDEGPALRRRAGGGLPHGTDPLAYDTTMATAMAAASRSAAGGDHASTTQSVPAIPVAVWGHVRCGATRRSCSPLPHSRRGRHSGADSSRALDDAARLADRHWRCVRVRREGPGCVGSASPARHDSSRTRRRRGSAGIGEADSHHTSAESAARTRARCDRVVGVSKRRSEPEPGLSMFALTERQGLQSAADWTRVASVEPDRMTRSGSALRIAA